MKTVLMYSGGLDSTVLLWWLRDRGDEVKALGVDYGQRHRRELDAARAVAGLAAIPFGVVDLSMLRRFLAGSSQTSDEVAVPDGHYTAETMRATVVPNRNMILLSVMIGHAISLGYDTVAYAAHGGDYAIYPDCRPEFVDAMDRAARIADWHPVRVERPFIEKTKAEVVRLGDELGAPLGKTWSCYKGGATHCGRCGACVERREAFRVGGVMDPTEYEP